MQGPQPTGTFNGLSEFSPWEDGKLSRGTRYRVIKEFIDFDGDVHPIGEEWAFVASIFSPYDELLLIGVRLPSGEEWKILLSATAEAQHAVIENILRYVAPISSQGT